MPWNGGDGTPGSFPTLGYLVADWIEENLIVPDGLLKGQPFILTNEQINHLLWTYRLKPNARPEMGSQAFEFYGALLVRPQKSGKDPLAAAQACVQALGPVRFAGWDGDGEPVGMEMPTPWIQCAANSEDQVDNTYRPIFTMLTEGPVANLPGLDVGLGRTNLPTGGRIEPVTAQARSRLGARITYATFTESGLYTEVSGGLALARTMKRGLAGMDGRWMELTNAWDPAEESVAQRTYAAKAPGVYIDYRPPRTSVDLDDDAALRAELVYVYGDSAVENGGWVRIERIMEEIRDPATGKHEARRFFLNEVTVGSSDAVDAIKWAAQARPNEKLEPLERIALGFTGTQKDSASLVACRMSDGRLFHLRTWEKPPEMPSARWKIPREEVSEAVDDAWLGYRVLTMLCNPQHWQNEVNEWAGQYGAKLENWARKAGDFQPDVLELWLNSEMRMDQIIERFQTAHQGNEITHDNDPTLTLHALSSAIADGKRRSSAEDRMPGQTEFYRRIVRKIAGASISAFLGALLANEARGWAIEHGALMTDDGPPSIW